MSRAAIPFERLFDPEFLAALSHLKIAANRVAGGGHFGNRLSRDLGIGPEFRDYRAYTPGDDLRAIDWNIYRRLGRLFLRLYEEQQDLPLYLMPDISPSMFFEPAPRALTALRCALAFAVVSLNHHDSVTLLPFDDQVKVRVKSMSGKASTMAFAQHLARLSAASAARTDLAGAFRRVATMNLRRGLLVVISDFFDPNGLDMVAEALRAVRHRLLFVQVVRKNDAEPELAGELRLRDCETGGVTEVTITPHVLQKYRDAYGSFVRRLTEMVRHLHGGLLQIDADIDLLQQLNALFGSGQVRV
jgi:uncharacterized protein (DUF58 family)